MSPLPLRTFLVEFVEFATYYDYVLAATAKRRSPRQRRCTR